MKLEVGKQYKLRNGQLGRVVCTDMRTPTGDTSAVMLVQNYVGMWEYPLPVLSNGRVYESVESEYDVVDEYSIWQAIKPGTIVAVDGKYLRRFKKYADGLVYVYHDGSTISTNGYNPRVVSLAI